MLQLNTADHREATLCKRCCTQKPDTPTQTPSDSQFFNRLLILNEIEVHVRNG